MTQEESILEKFKALVGKEAEPEVWDAEKGQMKHLARAIGDPNPLWQDMDYARKTRYGTVIGPPLFLIDRGLVKFVDRMVDMAPDKANINGGTEIEYFQPIKAGDTITTVARLADVQEKVGKSGSMIFLHIEVKYTNQRGELAAICRNTFIRK
jgi:acyl dehydratase